MKKTLIPFLAFLLLVFAGCNNNTTQEDAAKATIYLNAESMNNEDIDLYMETIHPESPLYGATERMVQTLFEQYDLKVTLKDVKVEKIEDDLAEVLVVQQTRKLAGGDFQDNEVETRNVLKLHNGKWKFFSSQILNTGVLE